MCGDKRGEKAAKKWLFMPRAVASFPVAYCARVQPPDPCGVAKVWQRAAAIAHRVRSSPLLSVVFLLVERGCHEAASPGYNFPSAFATDRNYVFLFFFLLASFLLILSFLFSFDFLKEGNRGRAPWQRRMRGWRLVVLCRPIEKKKKAPK